MAFREGLKEWWNDPEKFFSRRYPGLYRRIFRRPTRRERRESLWFLVGIGVVGAIKDYSLGLSLGFIASLDLTPLAAGVIGLAIMWWKDRRTRQ